MSFDVFLIASSASPQGAELRAATGSALALCGARRGAKGDADFVLASGQNEEFFTSDDGEAGGMFATRGLSPELVNLMFELADATQCFITFPSEEPAVLRTPGNTGEIPDEGMEVIPIADASDLRGRLEGGLGGPVDDLTEITGSSRPTESGPPADSSLLDRFFKRSAKDD